MQVAEHSTQRRAFGTYLFLAAASLGVQLVVALPITLRIWKAALRPGAFSWDRADAFSIPIFLLLQSAIGAFFLWRLRRGNNYLLHTVKGILVGLCGFLIATPLSYVLLRFSYKSLPTIPPSFFFMLVFFLGHRIPLLGVLLGSFVTASVQWSRSENKFWPTKTL